MKLSSNHARQVASWRQGKEIVAIILYYGWRLKFGIRIPYFGFHFYVIGD